MCGAHKTLQEQGFAKRSYDLMTAARIRNLSCVVVQLGDTLLIMIKFPLKKSNVTEEKMLFPAQ